ncbi:MAG TPA: PKD domain-containing protein [Acidimicrobiales bacterium]
MADETRNIPRRQRPQGSPHRGRRLIALALTTAVAFTVVGIGNAQALITTTQPQLTLNHFIRTTPFVGTSTEVQDNEGSAYVAGDDALWMASDNDDALWVIDRTTGALRRKVAQAAFINAPRYGVGGAAGQARTEDLEALAYDANADVIYAFSGSTSATPTAFRLTRDGNNQFQVQSWQPLPTEWTGAGWRAADGLTYVAEDSTIRTYNYTTNSFGPAFSISGLSKIFGVDFDDVTGDLLAVNSSERLYRASMTTRTILPGWNGISLTSFGLLDTRAVEVVGEQLLVTDGADSSVRPHTDPMSHAVFVLDVSGPAGPAPTASFNATPTTGLAPLTVNFADTSTGGPTSWAWDFGDGGTSTAQSPSHTYTSTGTYTATLTATNGQGSTSASRTIAVTQPTAPTASFNATPSTGTVPLVVSFTDTSTGAPTSWAWDFGDGGTSTAQSPSHTYTSTGTFTASLTATNAQGSTSTTRSITVNTAPTQFTVPLEADTYVNTSSPTKNYATSDTMKLKFEPPAEYRSLIRFTLNGLSGPPSSVRLRMFVTDASSRGGDWYLVSNNWVENTVVWGNKPAISGSPVASVGAVSVGTWVEVNLTPAITGNGTYSFEATTTVSNTMAFDSSQGTNPPQVIVVA